MRFNKFLILVLAALSVIVFVCLISNVYPWGWICGYWIVLAIKNVIDFFSDDRRYQ